MENKSHFEKQGIQLHTYIRPLSWGYFSPGHDGNRALPPLHFNGLLWPLSPQGFERAGLTCFAISENNLRNRW